MGTEAHHAKTTIMPRRIRYEIPELTGEDLRAIRQTLRLTQEQLAEALGLHRVTISYYESGRLVIPNKIARLARRLR